MYIYICINVLQHNMIYTTTQYHISLKALSPEHKCFPFCSHFSQRPAAQESKTMRVRY